MVQITYTLNKIKVQTSNDHFGINTLKTDNCPLKTKKSYELEDNLGNLENLNKIMVQITYNLNKIKVQTSMANGH
jgi:hypothetical protein